MIRYIYGHDLHLFPLLRDSMFRDRADQFKTRLGWAVTVDEAGFERDEYDAEDPLYVIWEEADGTHGGSMRLLPTTGADHGQRPLSAPDRWRPHLQPRDLGMHALLPCPGREARRPRRR